MKQCKYCLETKPLINFHQGSKFKDGYSVRCRQCFNSLRKDAKELERFKKLHNIDNKVTWQDYYANSLNAKLKGANNGRT